MKKTKKAFISGIVALMLVCLMGSGTVFALPGGVIPMTASVESSSALSMSDLPIEPTGKSFIHNPTTFTNPISLTNGSGSVITSGEPIITVFDDYYILTVRGQRGYWWSNDFVDWTWVSAPNLLGGIPGFVEIDGKLYNYAGNTENRVRTTDDPKTGIWYDAGTFSSNNYGDASMLYDEETGRLYMYYGWSQLLGIRVVELDKTTFKEIGEPIVAIWGDPHNHGWETRYASDNIFPYFTHREYREQEYGWTEGGHPLKYNGKYYLMYASIGLEFYSYGHGVYVADDPLGPYEYSEHNPLTMKTTGVAPGAGHGSIFLDKQGKVWTVCMLPYALNGGRGHTLISLFPSDVDAEGVMHGKVEFGDYPQYLPGVKTDPINDNYTGWTLLSLDKRVETSSIYDWHLNYWPAFAVDEDPKSYWSAATGDPGEYITVDLGEVSDIRGVQILWDRTATYSASARYRSYTVEVSDDNENWTMIIDKSNNTQDLPSDYIELPAGVTGRYVKLTNVYMPGNGRFAVKAFRVFGNPDKSTFTKVDDVTVVRSELDRRKASLVWEQVDDAEGYVVRYGIEPDKLYNSYTVYWDNYLDIKSLNVGPEYYFEVEAFSSGTPRYVENTFETRGRGAEINYNAPNGVVPAMDAGTNRRFMTYESPNKEDEVYSLYNCTPGNYSFTHAFGVGIWPTTALTAEQLTGGPPEYELSAVYPNLSQFGIGEERWGSVEVRVYRGPESGRVDLVFKYDRPGEFQISAVARDGSTASAVTSAMTGIRCGEEVDGKVNRIVYTLEGGTFANTITPADFAISGLPAGLVGTVERTSDTTVTVHISGTVPAAQSSIGSYPITFPATVGRENVVGAGAGEAFPVIVAPLSITVARAAGATVDTPTATSPTGDTITVNPVAAPANGQTVEYAINTSATTAPTTGWGTATTFTDRTPGATYYVWARAAQNDVYSAGTAARSAVIIAGAVKAAGATVDAPTATSSTSDTITVSPVAAPGNGQTVEYAINTSGATTPTSGWGTSTTFTGRSPNTSYYVWARAAENDDYIAGTAVRSDVVIINADTTRSLPIEPTGKDFIHNPKTYTNPISLTQGTGGVLTSGEPIVRVFDDYYILTMRGRTGYWVSDDFVDWTYIAAPSLLGGIPGFVEIDGKLYNYAGNANNRVMTTDDPKSGVWYQAGNLSSSNYGDASMLYDEETGRLFMYYGWSQLLGIRVVELDKTTFKEIGEPVVAIWGDPHNHGWETRWAYDNIFPLGSITREYRPQEYGWTEGGHPLKYKGKYYLMYASIGLEFFSYGHGVYVADDPLGPYEYSEHNPLTMKTTGVAPGAGHGSIFLDKQEKVWTICMLPYALNAASGHTLISLFPSDVDAEGVMHGKVEHGDYPQYLPGVKEDPIEDNYTGWSLLSLDKRVETSSTYEAADGQYWPAFAVDEDPKSYWSAQTGDPGEYMTVDLGKVSDIRGVQILWDRTAGNDGTRPPYRSYTVEVSDDNQNWIMVIDKSNNTQDLPSDYIELDGLDVTGRYVKLTNVITPGTRRFAVKAFRIFGNPEETTFTKVDNVTAIRNKLDRRYAHLVWEPVDGAEGYVVRYGIEPDKLYNSYMVYWDNYLDIPSLNVGPEYYFEVEAFSSGTPRYVENTFETRGRGAELQFTRRPTGGASTTDYVMTYETFGRDEVYVFNDITPGTYTLTHRYGVGIWGPQQLTAEQLIGTGTEPTLTALNLTQFGIGSTQWGTVEVRVYPGETSGRVEVRFKYDVKGPYNTPTFYDGGGETLTSLSSETLITEMRYINASDQAESLTMYVAVYSPDGKMVYHSNDSKEIPASQTTEFAVTLNMPENADGHFATEGYYAKVFLWDSGTYVPVLKEYTFK